MKIGVFDSGYGGLTILRCIKQLLPQYDYIYLGDNARTPYGTRSFQVVYDYTLESVKRLFELDCQLVILACNTASAKALRSIQQQDLPTLAPTRRVLGVIRPTVEALGEYTHTKSVGLLATEGTVRSNSYPLEVAKLYPQIKVYSQACPMWVPLIESGEHTSAGADFFVKKYVDSLLAQSADIDTVILGCTHYPLLIDKIREVMPKHINLLVQGDIVAASLKDYLARHPEIETLCSKGGIVEYYTTESVERFAQSASIFVGDKISASKIII